MPAKDSTEGTRTSSCCASQMSIHFHAIRLLLLSILLSAAASAGDAAGIRYSFDSTSTGAISQQISGEVLVEGGRSRITLSKGDGVLFEGGEVLLTSESSPIVTVLVPKRSRYYEVDINDISAVASRLSSGMRGFVDLKFATPQVRARTFRAKPVDGRQTRGYEVRSSVAVSVKILGAPQKATIESVSHWITTDSIPASAMSFLQRPRSGGAQSPLDQLFATEAAAVHGFPLIQKRTTTTRIGKRAQATVTETRVTNIRSATAAPHDFSRPSNFQKEEPPLGGIRRLLGL